MVLLPALHSHKHPGKSSHGSKQVAFAASLNTTPGGGMGSTGGGGNIKPAQESSTGHNRHSGNKNHLMPPATTATTEISQNNNGGERENRKLISTTISSSSSQNKAQATVANCRNSSVGGTSKLKSGRSAVRSSSENSKKANKSVTFQDHPGEPGPRSSESGKLVQQVWFTFNLQSLF